MTDSTAVAVDGRTDVAVGGHPARGGRRLSLNWLGVVPFFGYVGLFLLLPTVLVAVEAFRTADGHPTLENVRQLGRDPTIVGAFRTSITISFETALLGAVFGAVLAYVIATGKPDGVLRRSVTAVCGVLAQFGGIMLAFAFIVTVGPEGLLTLFLSNFGIDIGGLWLFETPGLILVYTYFQVPLMVLVFMPSLDGIRPQWREATEGLGGTTWDYWRHVAFPILTPPFLGAFLLLFANAFSAYATAAALISQGAVILPLRISIALRSEVVLGQENVGKALALGMILVVALVMVANSLLQRRSSRWLQ